jgi:hypothetical protein
MIEEHVIHAAIRRSSDINASPMAGLHGIQVLLLYLFQNVNRILPGQHFLNIKYR